MYSKLSFESFIGKKIVKALISSDKYNMFWLVEDQWFNIEALGDGRSISWFAHCNGGDSLQGAILNEFEDVYLGGDDDRYGGPYIQVNMLKFRTSEGYCTIEFRNSSNGYYSGYYKIKACSDPGEQTVLDEF